MNLRSLVYQNNSACVCTWSDTNMKWLDLVLVEHSLRIRIWVEFMKQKLKELHPSYKIEYKALNMLCNENSQLRDRTQGWVMYSKAREKEPGSNSFDA